MTSYNILIFDDDPLYLDLLESKLIPLNDNNNLYCVNIHKATRSRDALKKANSVVFDIIILDICQKQRYHSISDKYDYQGHELYKKILEYHPDWEPYTKFIILSNLPVENARETFNYSKADYLHKDDHNCKSVAQIVKMYIETDYNTVQKLYCNRPKEFSRLISQIEQNVANNIGQEELLHLEKIIDNLRPEIKDNTITRLKVEKFKESLKCIKGGVEFTAAVTALIEFLSTYFSS